jgi:signal transduction histidine kinase/CheY-like chemotaxis protein
MYAPGIFSNDVADTHPNYDLLGQIGNLSKDEFTQMAHAQAYAGMENPHGQRFEGIVRWATPVADEKGEIIGYVTFALNHDHIMEFVDYITPTNERYTSLPNAYEGNYAFIWDYQSRSICHPRHHSIVGFDPNTGERQVPWLETSLYDEWQTQGDEFPYWWDYFEAHDVKTFDNQSREKVPAVPLTAAGLVGLDGRYLNNAPQCTGWMDLTESGGSGSFYILWSGLYKLTTAAAIPYYTGQYAPNIDNDFSNRGFGFVTIGAGLDDFTQAARDTQAKLVATIDSNMRENITRLVLVSSTIVLLVIFMAFVLASYLTNSIQYIINGISRFRNGERQFRLHSTANDELRTLADSFDEMADSIEKSVSDPLSIVDTDYKIIYMNQLALELVGKKLDEAIGMPYFDVSLYPEGTVYCPITALQENFEVEVLYKEESGNYYKGHANYLLDKEGNVTGYIIVSNDVTEIELARQKSESANVAKSNFLSNMSHEMRTPLNAILGMTTIGLTDTSPEKKVYALNKIQDASTHLLGVINDVLDMSKIEASKFTLFNTEFVFEKMFQRVFDVIHFRIDEKQQKLTAHIDESIPDIIIADEQRLAQVIMNLLTNAVKFTPNGGSIHIEATALAQDAMSCTLQISISDSGIGISKEQQKRLFHAFEQAEASTSRKFGGTGLGLKISRSIVEMMDGNIEVTSKPDEGSTFTFTVTVGKGKSTPKKLLNSSLSSGKIKILAVDDDPCILEFFIATAKRIGIACDVADNAAKALSLLTQKGPYNLHFVDWLMPEMDGIELARKIQEQTELESIVMMSAYNWSDMKDQAQIIGITKFLPKPLFMSSVVDCINEVLANETIENASHNLAEDDFSGITILLAEDVEINQEIILALLSPTGIQIDCANNGKEAVSMFQANPSKYQMIFMDLQMPEMDGIQATIEIRKGNTPNASTVPIVAMTANVFKEDIEKCMATGMNGHVGKPIQLEEVLEQLRKHLKN